MTRPPYDQNRAAFVANGAALAAFAILVLAAWQFSAVQRNLEKQIAAGDAAFAVQHRIAALYEELATENASRPDRVPALRRSIALAQASALSAEARVRKQRERTQSLTQLGLLTSLVLLGCIGTWLAAFTVTVRRAKVHRASALRDPLTGVGNRNGAIAMLQDLTRNTRGESFGVIFLDLDGFKRINDVHGHARGDALLQGVAKRLKRELRESDCVARLGGDEFICIIAPPTTRSTLAAVAQRLQHAVTRPYGMDGDDYIIGASAGYSLFPEDGIDAAMLLDRADRAMYAAKAAGGGVHDAGW